MGLQALAKREGWRREGVASRVHYDGEGERYSIEYYEPTDAVVYWKILDEDVAVPVDRADVPGPLRDRIRLDLEAADIDPEVERRPV